MYRSATPGGAVVTGTSPRPGTAPAGGSFSLACLACLLLIGCTDGSSVTPIVDIPGGDLTADAPSLTDSRLLIQSGDEQEGAAASYLPEPLVVQVVDATGAPIPHAPVRWRFQRGAGRAGAGQQLQSFVVLTEDDGTASVQWQMSPQAGSQSVEATIVLPMPSTASGVASLSAAPGNGNDKKVGFRANAKPGDVEYIAISPPSALVAVADSFSLHATAVDQYGNPIDGLGFQWSSSDETTATVSDDGVVYPSAEGSFVVSAKYKRTTGSASLIASSTTGDLSPNVSIVSPVTDVTLLLGEEIAFEGSVLDPDATVASHRWTFGDGGSASVQNPEAYTYSSEGIYTVTYQVTDDQGATASATREVTVTSELNAPPSATIQQPVGNLTVAVGEDVYFQGAATDADGTVIAHNWIFGDGSSSTQEVPGPHAYSAEGVYTVTYQAMDDDSATSSLQSITVTASPAANQHPTASIDSPASNLVITLGQSVDFRGSANDVDGSVTSHLWTFGDGGFASAEDPGPYTYRSTGTFSVTYEVTDDDGAAASATRTVSVEEAGEELTVLFQCDWPNIGLDAADCGNTTFSAEVETSDAGVSVVDATDFGLSSNWPNDRAMLVRCQDRSGGCARQVVRNLHQWPIPKAGDVLAFRVSRTTASEVLGSNSGNWNDHGFKTSPRGGSNATTFTLASQANTDGSWRLTTSALEGSSWPDGRWCVVEVGGTGGCNGPDLVWFDGYAEYELHIKYTFPTDNSYIVDAKIYDIVGDSLTNWTWQNINGSKTLPSPEYTVDVAGGENWNWDQISLGHSATGEPNWDDLAGAPMILWGGYAVCAGDWCPRYGGVAGEGN